MPLVFSVTFTKELFCLLSDAFVTRYQHDCRMYEVIALASVGWAFVIALGVGLCRAASKQAQRTRVNRALRVG